MSFKTLVTDEVRSPLVEATKILTAINGVRIVFTDGRVRMHKDGETVTRGYAVTAANDAVYVCATEIPEGAELQVAAPITIAGKKYYMGVMLQRDSANQRLYLHDVITEEAVIDTSGDNLNTTGSAEEDNDLYITSILLKALFIHNGLCGSKPCRFR